MAASVLYVSVAQSYRPWMSLPALEPWVERAWAITATRAATCDRVLAVVNSHPIAAWRLRGAFPSTEETYAVADGGTRPRTCLALGDPLPLLPAYFDQPVPALRRGVAVQTLEHLMPLRPDQQHDLLD